MRWCSYIELQSNHLEIYLIQRRSGISTNHLENLSNSTLDRYLVVFFALSCYRRCLFPVVRWFLGIVKRVYIALLERMVLDYPIQLSFISYRISNLNLMKEFFLKKCLIKISDSYLISLIISKHNKMKTICDKTNSLIQVWQIKMFSLTFRLKFRVILELHFPSKQEVHLSEKKHFKWSVLFLSIWKYKKW